MDGVLELDFEVGIQPGRLTAARNGVIHYQQEKALDVVEQHVHQGDVDLHTGNLQARGSLRVQGSVRRGCTAGATGDVEITGSVDAGHAFAVGDLQITGGVVGGETGHVAATGSIGARHA